MKIKTQHQVIASKIHHLKIRTQRQVAVEVNKKLKEVKSSFPIGSIIHHPKGDIIVQDLKKFKSVLPCGCLPVGVCYDGYYLYIGVLRNNFRLKSIILSNNPSKS